MKLLVSAACVLLASWVAPVAGVQSNWHFPVAIEALKDVPSQTTVESGKQRRGVLYVNGGQPFVIKKGQRFLMVQVEQEGGCRIKLANREYSVSSCPWLDGFTDHQADVFKVVSELETTTQGKITTEVRAKEPVRVLIDVVSASGEQPPLAEVWARADAIVHLRVSRAFPARPQRQSDGSRLLCTEHDAEILEVLKSDKVHGPVGRHFTVLQESAGVWEEDGGILKGALPYRPGTELVAFLTWRAGSERFAVWRDPLAVVNGRVYRFWWGETAVNANEESGPLFLDVPRGAPVQDLLAKLRTLADAK